MTSYIAITNAETDPEAPLTSELAKKWRDNPIAITEGAAGAPRILGEAIARGYDLPPITVSAADTYLITEGANPESGTLTNQTATDVVAGRYTMQVISGVVRAKASHFVNNAAGTSTLSLYKNGVLVQAFTTQSLSAVARSVDVSVAINDVLEWRHKINNTAYISNASSIAMYGSNAYIAQSAFRKAV